MRSICLTSSAKAFFSLAVVWTLLGAASPAEEENYSLWPRRPAGLEKAAKLEAEGKTAEAIAELNLLITRDDVIGKEARDLMGEIRIKQALDPERCGAEKYRVQRGDGWFALAQRKKCPLDMIIHLNQYVSLPTLQPGQTILIKEMNYALTVDMVKREVVIRDQDQFIKAYPIVSTHEVQGSANVSTVIKNETGMYGTIPVKSSDYGRFPASDKTMILGAKNWVITSSKDGKMRAPGIYLTPGDCNEISLLMRPGNKVDIIFAPPKKTNP